MDKVLVIGDSCIDEFQYGVCERISPEAPVPIFKSLYGVQSSGMASNVKNNLEGLGISCDIITNTMVKPHKLRFVDKKTNQMLLRVDGYDRIVEKAEEYLVNINFNDYDAIVISDYDKGFLTENTITNITNKHKLVFLDSKKKFGKWADGIEFIKVNENEFNNNSKYLIDDFKGELIITLGDEGARHNDVLYHVEQQYAIINLAGAGDTFFAGFVANYLEFGNIPKAINFANKCASWVVSQKGVGVINKSNI
ncbi:MAG TPA: PfkB family carbohydrate kinase [archaeon]|nr:PfkB family carbohydrate kinase [archaeon]